MTEPKRQVGVSPVHGAVPKPGVAIGYIRVSSRIQLTEGHGLDAQRAALERWASYQGVALSSVEADEAVSGATAASDRAGLRRALRAVLQAPGSTLVVFKLDRLGRSAIDVQETLAVLLDAGVRVVSVGEGVDSSSGMGAAMFRLLTNILATFAELERDSIRTRTLEGKRRAREEGRRYAREPPYGQRFSQEGRLEDDPGELATVARARELRASGLTLAAIGAELARERHKPRRGAWWHPEIVRRMLGGAKPATKARAKRLTRARADLLG